MVLRTMTMTMLLAVSASACYVESVDEQRDSVAGRKISTDQRQEDGTNLADVGQCRVTALKGCFDGHVISKKEFLVEGKTFFNADDLASRFAELITVERLGDQLKDGEDYRLELLTGMDNPSFLQGFEYYLSGATVRAGNVRNNGVFNINELTEGTYDLRLQKALQFQVIQTITQAPLPDERDASRAKPAESTASEAAVETTPELLERQTVVKTYCATLYADKTIDIRRGERVWEPLNEFRLHVIDRDCPAAGSGRVVTIKLSGVSNDNAL